MAPTYWSLFNTGSNNAADGPAQTAAAAAGTALAAGIIVAIVLGAIALVVLLAMIIGGVGIFAARKKLFPANITVDGKELVQGKAISVGAEIEMTEDVARGMLGRGELTSEQFAEMGFDNNDEVLPNYEQAVNPHSNNIGSMNSPMEL
jgi:hypothetical protein